MEFFFLISKVHWQWEMKNGVDFHFARLSPKGISICILCALLHCVHIVGFIQMGGRSGWCIATVLCGWLTVQIWEDDLLEDTRHFPFRLRDYYKEDQGSWNCFYMLILHIHIACWIEVTIEVFMIFISWKNLGFEKIIFFSVYRLAFSVNFSLTRTNLKYM